MKEIAKLKKYILESKALNEPVNYFFDLIDQKILLHAVGSRKINDIENHPVLCAAINVAIDIINKSFNKKIDVSNKVFTEVPEEKFFHGYCIIEDHPIPLLILYCADLELGIAALADLNSPTHFFRFSVTSVRKSENKH